jgi:Tol biopolymer transport system component
MNSKPAAAAFATVLALGTTGLTAVTTGQPAAAGSSPALIAFDNDASGVYEFTPGVTQPTLVAKAGVFPQFSPNGMDLAYEVAHESYVGDPKGKNTIVVANRTGGDPHVVLSGPISWKGNKNDVHYPLAWSPNGKELAYGCDGTSDSMGGNLESQLCVVDLDTGAHHMITAAANPNPLVENAGFTQRLSWTPNGRDLIADVVVSQTCAPGTPAGTTCASNQVASINADSGSVSLITHSNGTTEIHAWAPTLSADGKQIAYYRVGDPNTKSTLDDTGIWVMDIGGAHDHEIFSGYTKGNIAPESSSLAFSPNGEDILFTSYGVDSSGHVQAAYEIKADGKGDPVALTGDNLNVYDAVWTPTLTTCTVPNLKHKTLAQAKKELKKAACSLGKVTGPKTHRSKRHIVSQSPKANRDEPAGTRVNVKVK